MLNIQFPTNHTVGTGVWVGIFLKVSNVNLKLGFKFFLWLRENQKKSKFYFPDWSVLCFLPEGIDGPWLKWQTPNCETCSVLDFFWWLKKERMVTFFCKWVWNINSQVGVESLGGKCPQLKISLSAFFCCKESSLNPDTSSTFITIKTAGVNYQKVLITPTAVGFLN